SECEERAGPASARLCPMLFRNAPLAAGVTLTFLALATACGGPAPLDAGGDGIGGTGAGSSGGGGTPADGSGGAPTGNGGGGFVVDDTGGTSGAGVGGTTTTIIDTLPAGFTAAEGAQDGSDAA